MLVRDWKNPNSLEYAPTRNGYGDGLIEAGKKNNNIIVLCADLTESTKCEGFKQMFPKRFVQIGVAEQSLAAIGAGMALAGKTVFISSYAAFSPGRNWEQIRTTGCLQNTNLIIAGSHAGISVGPDGATHQMTEDIALMRVLPNMIVLSPADAIEARKTTLAAAICQGPIYIRLAREKSPIFTTQNAPFAIGQASVLTPGNDVAIIGTGPLVYECLMASLELEKMGIKARVINNSSIKPLDEKTVLKAAKDCRAIVTVEEAQIAGGMGSAICELVSSELPVPVERVGLQDVFGQSGTAEELFKEYKLTREWIVKAAKKVIKRKL